MTRRGFLSRLLAVPIAAAMAPHVSATPVLQPSTLTFNPDAFKGARFDRQMSIRYIKKYDIATDRQVQRFDVLYGMATINPSFAVRVQS